MRYRLRTLLILITVAAIVCARIAYLRQRSAMHRQAATQILTRINQMSEAQARNALRRLLAGGIPIKTIEVTSMETAVTALENQSGTGQIVEVDRTADWQRALHHEALAIRYERAAYRPWLVIDESER
ncbi:MAG TPA: hypothetical protein VGI40_18015 [Pirellulaceae bacterium]|jgi:hypothetical protein